ncbi:hypothetical protein BpHYR1_038806 [Brachionus plicatilis]|uniref:Uncharacterized protein n=1 Tax=Brachionus plicatilis TaxID=10195 RepID=A0A3M7QQF3_BRAPC|nr:hypothetical protein BpHYR1_038806 [Brachionus plicatilis]
MLLIKSTKIILDWFEITGMDKEKQLIFINQLYNEWNITQRTPASSLPNSGKSGINVNTDDDNSQTLSNEKSRPLATWRNESFDNYDPNTNFKQFWSKNKTRFPRLFELFQNFHRFLYLGVLLNVCSRNQAIEMDDTEQD